MSILQREFSAGEVVAAAGVTAPNFQAWIRRGILMGHPGAGVDMPGNAGRKRRLTFHNVMEVAVAKTLMDGGWAVQPAFKAAQVYAHIGEGCSSDGISIIVPGEKPREPALPFTGAYYTLLCANVNRTEVVRWAQVSPTDEVTRELYSKVGGDAVISRLRNHEGAAFGFHILEMRPIFERVVQHFGYAPFEVMKEAYNG